jgi:hypothetical protein
MAISLDSLVEALEEMQREGPSNNNLEQQLFALAKLTYIDGVTDREGQNFEEVLAGLLARTKKLSVATIHQALYLATAVGVDPK